jgi:hypothetical protein
VKRVINQKGRGKRERRDEGKKWREKERVRSGGERRDEGKKWRGKEDVRTK